MAVVLRLQSQTGCATCAHHLYLLVPRWPINVTGSNLHPAKSKLHASRIVCMLYHVSSSRCRQSIYTRQALTAVKQQQSDNSHSRNRLHMWDRCKVCIPDNPMLGTPRMSKHAVMKGQLV